MENPSSSESLSELLQRPPNLSHLKRLTTPLGIVQHATGDEPDLAHGYSIDDGTRALIVCIWYADLYGKEAVEELAAIYLRHIVDAQLSDGRFHNFKDKEGKFLDKEVSQDSFGRAVWALAVATTSELVDKGQAKRALEKALPHVTKLIYPRSVAFALLGVQAQGDKGLVNRLGQRLAGYFQKNAQKDWQWFEPCLRYSNGILPYSLLLLDEKKLSDIGMETLAFLNTASRVNGVPAPIGNKGWYCQGGERAIFDQQCIEAADMVLANLAAQVKTGKVKYFREAQDWTQWFYGGNLKKTAVVTREGGCYDGINEDAINSNQGAESVLAYLLAVLAMAKSAGRSSRSNL